MFFRKRIFVKILNKKSKSRTRLCTNNKSGFTLIELLVFIWILIFAMNGFSKGMRFASQYGPWGAILGAVGGFLAGAIVAIALMILFIYTIDLIKKFSAWWRPNPPACDNGCCHSNDYESTETPLTVRKHVKGILYNAYRCNCGNLYTKLGYLSLKTQWVRILPDNTVQAYLKHYPFSRWKPDTSDKIEMPASDNERQWDIDLHSTKNLTPTQQGWFLLVLIPSILSIVLISSMVLLPLSLGKEIALVSTRYGCVLLFFIGPALMGLQFFITILVTGKSCARLIEADADCIRIQRYDKQEVQVQWSQIISVKHKGNINSKNNIVKFWIIQTPEEKMSIRSEGFLHEDWQLISDYIKQHIPENCQLKES